jgi:nucleoside-diphosphate-sugar epimerase
MDMLIFGAGYSGRAIADRVLKVGGRVSGTTRSPAKAAELEMGGIEPHLFDGSLSGALAARLAEVSHLVVSIAPDHGMRDGAAQAQGGTVDPVLGAASGVIAQEMPKLRWIGYLSTVGVYGDHGGAWIDEQVLCRPQSRRSRMRLEAEDAWLALGERLALPVAVLRLSGIYGPGRNAFVNLDKGSARRIVKQGQVFNRIHVDDIAGAAVMLAQHATGGIFNVTDDLPAPPQDVVAYAASLMGVAPPPEIAFEDADMTPMGRSFYGENKRVSNATIKAAGHAFKFPTYRDALDDLWRTGTWRGRADGVDARSPIGP